MKRKYNIKIIIFAICILLTGVGIILYPIVSNCLAEIDSSKLINKYIESIDDTFDAEEELKKAQTYNENLAGDPVHDPFLYGSGFALPENYLDVLNIDGVMAYIEIPKISLKLPIYHGTSSEVLEKGVGHMQMTSLPIGGINSHSILTGHRGLPSAKLFSDLDKLEEGDIIKIHVLNETLAYKVYNIEEIEPQDIESLRIVQGEDIITLVTCTPYGINTHRLLVHATRTEIDIEESKQDLEKDNDISINNNYKILTCILIFVIILIISLVSITMYLSFVSNRRKDKNKKNDKEEKTDDENEENYESELNIINKENNESEQNNENELNNENNERVANNEEEITKENETNNENEFDDKNQI